MQPQHLEATGDYEHSAKPADRDAPRPVAFAPASATPTAELQSLLRKRLRFAAFLFIGIGGVAIGLEVWEWLLSGPGVISLTGQKLHFLVAVLVAWRLGKVDGWSLARLRGYEGILFGSILIVKLYLAFNWALPRALTSHAL